MIQMIQTHRARFRFVAAFLMAAALLLSGLPEASARRGGGDDGGGGDDALKLRANDAIGKRGGVVALGLRTYAARPIRQGQISVRVRPGGAANAASTLSGPTVEALRAPVRPLTFLNAVVYSTRGDSAIRATPTGAANSPLVNV